MEKTLSIITVCYNAESSIRQTIESVLSQTFSDYEYIVIDGASTDKTVEIISEYRDRIDVFISEPDKGIYDAMNKGIDHASGEWITFRNSGDLFLSPDSLRQFFEQPVPDTVDIVHGDCVFVNEWGYRREKPSLDYKRGMPVLHPASFVRSRIHKQRKFDTTFRSSGDYAFMYGCFADGLKFEYRPIPIVLFPVGGYAMANIKRTYFEDCRIKGYDRTPGGRIRTRIGAIVLSFKIFLLQTFGECAAFKRMRKKSLLNKGWKQLPYDVNDL